MSGQGREKTDDFKAGVGMRIRSYRKSRYMKGKDLARVLEISQSSLSEIESGKSSPSARTLLNFFLNTDIDVFWALSGKKREPAAGAYPQWPTLVGYVELHPRPRARKRGVGPS
jgi:transcriptional regulator with XRE-family HTH domain